MNRNIFNILFLIWALYYHLFTGSEVFADYPEMNKIWHKDHSLQTVVGKDSLWKIRQGILLKKNNGDEEQDILLTCRFPNNQIIKLEIWDGEKKFYNIQFEQNREFESKQFFVPAINSERQLNVHIVAGDYRESRKWTLKPVAPFDIYVVMHTHTDLGYTQPQVELEELHLDFIDRAVEYARMTENNPPEERFRWTCEASWAVERYLRLRPQESIDELLRQVRNGNIEITALYANQTSLLDYEEMIRYLQDARHIESQLGVSIVTAQNSDVNGIPWSFASLFEQSGVKYLLMAINEGWQGHAPYSEKRPNGFCWQGPDGKKVLVWNGEIYHKGNTLGLMTGSAATPQKMSEHYATMLQNGYPLDFTLLPIQGVTGDNRPPNINICDVVHNWNTTYKSPKLQTALAKDFFARLEEHTEKLPVVSGEWVDWWADGPVCTALETGLSRRASVLLQAASALAVVSGNGCDYVRDINQLYRNNMLFKEHTWGGHNGASEHWEPYNLMIWNWKAEHVYRAWHGALKLGQKILRGYASGGGGEILIFNQFPQPFDGQAAVAVYRRGRYLLKGDYVIKDEEGEIVSSEWVPGSDWGYLNINIHLEPFAVRHLRVVPGEKKKKEQSICVSRDSILSSPFYKVSWDKDGITSIRDLRGHRELIDQASPFRFGSVIFEQPSPGKEADDRTFLSTFGKKAEFIRKSMCVYKIEVLEAGLDSKILRLYGKCPDSKSIETDITLYDKYPRIKVGVKIYRKINYSPVAYYVPFPFAVSDPDIYSDLSGAIGKPWREQLPGTCHDWYSIQDWAAVGNQHGGVIWVSEEAPLVQFGQIRTGNWNQSGYPQNGTIISWPLQEYTITHQEPYQEFHYYITSHSGDFSVNDAMRFAKSTVRKPIGFYYPVTEKGELVIPKDPLFQVMPDNIIVESIRPAQGAFDYIIRMREISGLDNNGKLILSSEASKVFLTDPLGKELAPLSGNNGCYQFTIKSHECLTLAVKISS